MDYDELLKRLRKKVYESMDLKEDMKDERLKELIDECVAEESKNAYINITTRRRAEQDIFNSIRKFDILQELLDDDNVTEIMINGYKNIFIERQGRISRWNKEFENSQKLQDIAHRIAALSNRLVNESVPIVDTRLSDGSRVNIVLSPIAIDGPVITIRKFYEIPLTMEKLIEMNSISKEAAAFLKDAVNARYNIFISGGTGSGKTTFLNILSDYIPKDERVITIEDSAELKLHDISNLVRLEARNANVEGKNAVTIRDLLKSSLRMRPDRIIVGEVRGEETMDMIQAMNTGHDGSLSTGHANSPTDMLSRLETMVLMGMDMPLKAIRQQIASAIDIVVHLGRLRDKSRRVLQIVEVEGLKNGEYSIHKLFEFEEMGEEDGCVVGSLVKIDRGLNCDDKMRAAGIYQMVTDGGSDSNSCGVPVL
ncbi:MAG: CpaF family protein [Lachnospira sp.]|nr:CpaF family protein [Lachnospira sp.]